MVGVHGEPGPSKRCSSVEEALHRCLSSSLCYTSELSAVCTCTELRSSFSRPAASVLGREQCKECSCGAVGGRAPYLTDCLPAAPQLCRAGHGAHTAQPHQQEWGLQEGDLRGTTACCSRRCWGLRSASSMLPTGQSSAGAQPSPGQRVPIPMAEVTAGSVHRAEC